MFDDWTKAKKLRFCLSGLSGTLFFLVIYAPIALLLQHYFSNLDDHLGAVIDAIISVLLAFPFGISVHKHVMLRLFPDSD